ncbi:MAG: hypothetical protein ACYDBV_08720 [Nitrospiria bacterium]
MLTSGFLIAVLTKVYDSIRQKDWRNIEMIAAVVILGGVVGFFHVNGIGSVGDGVIDGLSISGLFTFGSFVAGKIQTKG